MDIQLSTDAPPGLPSAWRLLALLSRSRSWRRFILQGGEIEFSGPRRPRAASDDHSGRYRATSGGPAQPIRQVWESYGLVVQGFLWHQPLQPSSEGLGVITRRQRPQSTSEPLRSLRDRFTQLALRCPFSLVIGAAWGRSRRHPGDAPLTIGPSISTIFDHCLHRAIRYVGLAASSKQHAPRFGVVRGPGGADSPLQRSVASGGSLVQFSGLITNSRCGLRLVEAACDVAWNPGHGSSGFKKPHLSWFRRPRAGGSAGSSLSGSAAGLGHQHAIKGTRCTGCSQFGPISRRC